MVMSMVMLLGHTWVRMKHRDPKQIVKKRVYLAYTY